MFGSETSELEKSVYMIIRSSSSVDSACLRSELMSWLRYLYAFDYCEAEGWSLDEHQSRGVTKAAGN